MMSTMKEEGDRLHHYIMNSLKEEGNFVLKRFSSTLRWASGWYQRCSSLTSI